MRLRHTSIFNVGEVVAHVLLGIMCSCAYSRAALEQTGKRQGPDRLSESGFVVYDRDTLDRFLWKLEMDPGTYEVRRVTNNALCDSLYFHVAKAWDSQDRGVLIAVNLQGSITKKTELPGVRAWVDNNGVIVAYGEESTYSGYGERSGKQSVIVKGHRVELGADDLKSEFSVTEDGQYFVISQRGTDMCQTMLFSIENHDEPLLTYDHPQCSLVRIFSRENGLHVIRGLSGDWYNHCYICAHYMVDGEGVSLVEERTVRFPRRGLFQVISLGQVNTDGSAVIAHCFYDEPFWGVPHWQVLDIKTGCVIAYGGYGLGGYPLSLRHDVLRDIVSGQERHL